MRRWLLLVAVVSLAGCGEPAVDVSIPPRGDDEHVADLAGILDEPALEATLSALRADDLDIVALTYETEQATCGEAVRAARTFVRDWGADVAIVAVARPGDFASDEEARRRCLGVQPLDDRAIPGSLREEIAEVLVPPRTATNDWDAAFLIAAQALGDA